MSNIVKERDKILSPYEAIISTFPEIMSDLEIMSQIRSMCKNGKDVEVRTDKNGELAVYEISKSRIKKSVRTKSVSERALTGKAKGPDNS